jgi:hypothetical protein
MGDPASKEPTRAKHQQHQQHPQQKRDRRRANNNKNGATERGQMGQTDWLPDKPAAPSTLQAHGKTHVGNVVQRLLYPPQSPRRRLAALSRLRVSEYVKGWIREGGEDRGGGGLVFYSTEDDRVHSG